MQDVILSIDQGTSSTRAALVNRQGEICALAQQEFAQSYPAEGWVEHDPEEIWASTLYCCRELMQKSGFKCHGLAITNQRETTLVWDRVTGRCIYPAIVWQDRRTASYCDELKAAGLEPMIEAKTGLLLDAYFSASKLRWILDNVEGAQAQAEEGELCFGTVDCFLLWRLSSGEDHGGSSRAEHRTDASNASRTLLFNIHTQDWDEDLLKLFNIPRAMLPKVEDNCADFGHSNADLLGHSLPILAMAGDQQAAMIGQACVHKGMIKSTYGTGCFMMLNTGSTVLKSQHRLLSTVAYRINGQCTYALEGSIFIAGAALQWLRDGLKLFASATDVESLARRAKTSSVVFVPALTGLGAPHWNADARGAILGLTRDTGINEIVQAALEAVCFQSRDLLQAMQADIGVELQALRVDGGMVANDYFVQTLADCLGLRVQCSDGAEASVIGVAQLAALSLAWYTDLDELAEHWHARREFSVLMDDELRQQRYRLWQMALRRVLLSEEDED